jgi:hypothetical protein
MLRCKKGDLANLSVMAVTPRKPHDSRTDGSLRAICHATERGASAASMVAA